MQFEELVSRFIELGVSFEKLQEENKLLREENKLLKEENRLQKEKIAELEDRLNLNSRNSSFPPSRDLYKKRRENKSKSGRKPGGQPGHKGHSRALMEADTIVDCPLEPLCCCGGRIAWGGMLKHQKVEIAAITPVVTEYHLQQGRCVKCRKKRTAPLPAGVSSDLLGNRAKSVVTALTGFLGNSKRDVQACLKSIFNLDISLGLLSKTEKRVSDHCESWYKELHEHLQDSAYLHIDETGHKNKGKRGWAWVMVNQDATLLKLTDSRGKKVLRGLLPDYDGMVVTDRYSAYTYFKAEQRQICWAHLSRDFERFAHSQDPTVRAIGEELKHLSDEMFAVYKAKQTKKIEEQLGIRRLRTIRKRLLYFLKQATHLNQSKQAVRVAKNILKAEEMMWKFLSNPQIEPTNNLAERQIRKFVIYRKRSFFTWSERGNRFLERILSLFLSCRQQNQNPFHHLIHLVAH